MQKLKYRQLIPHRYTHTEFDPYHQCNLTFNINNWLSCKWKAKEALAKMMKAEYAMCVNNMMPTCDFKTKKYKIQLGFVSNKSTKNIDTDGFYMCHKYFQDALAHKFRFNDSIKSIPHVEIKYLGMRTDGGDEELWAQLIELTDDDIPHMPQWMLERYDMIPQPLETGKDEDL